MYVISHKVLSIADQIHKWTENWRLSAHSAPWNWGNDCLSFHIQFPLYIWFPHICGSASADSANLRLCSIVAFIHVYVIGPTRLPRLRLIVQGLTMFLWRTGQYLSTHHSLQLSPFTPQTPSSCFTHLLVLYHSHWLSSCLFTNSGCSTFHNTFHKVCTPCSLLLLMTDTQILCPALTMSFYFSQSQSPH